jgi:hypothetical protein
MAQPNTALSPEWDRWFDETFTDLISSDDELTRAEFDALITAAWPMPAPPAPSDTAAPTTDPEASDCRARGGDPATPHEPGAPQAAR